MNLDFADVKPGLLNWVIIGLMSVTFIAFFKYMLAMWQVPGLSELVASL